MNTTGWRKRDAATFNPWSAFGVTGNVGNRTLLTPAGKIHRGQPGEKARRVGIGRPSTYAPTISTIQNRGYVVKEEREGKQRNFRVMVLKDRQIV
jgi:hypothetical protein